jgi:hypothetical protein
MAQIDPIASAATLHRSVVNREGDRVTLLERHNLRATLHAGSLLGQHEFSASEIAARF